MRLRLPPSLRALKHPNYRLWAAADLVSSTGSWMQVLGMSWLVLTSTGSATSVGLTILFSAVPMLTLGSWAGALADRLPTRPLALVTQSLHLLLAVALALIAIHGSSVEMIYGIAALGGAVSVFDSPAMGKLSAQVVPREDLGNALALGSVLNSTGRVLGMSLGGVLAGLVGNAALFAVNAASFLAVVVAVLAMRTGALFPLPRSSPERVGVRAGLRYLLGDHRLLVLFALGFVLSSVGRNYQVSMAAMSSGPLAAGSEGFGFLSTVFAVGTVLGGLFAAHRRELTLTLLLGTAAVTSVLQLLSGFSPGLLTFAASMLPIAVGAVLIDTVMGTRVQLDTAEDMRGRVIAAQGMVSAGAGALGGPLVGWLAETLGPGRALNVAGLVTVVATAVATVALLRLRRRRQEAEAVSARGTLELIA